MTWFHKIATGLSKVLGCGTITIYFLISVSFCAGLLILILRKREWWQNQPPPPTIMTNAVAVQMILCEQKQSKKYICLATRETYKASCWFSEQRYWEIQYIYCLQGHSLFSIQIGWSTKQAPLCFEVKQKKFEGSILLSLKLMANEKIRQILGKTAYKVIWNSRHVQILTCL